jgi:hypothetical protein
MPIPYSPRNQLHVIDRIFNLNYENYTSMLH